VGGVLTALEVLDAELIVVAACDVPLLDATTVRALVDAADADPAPGVVVAATDRPQWSLTCWRAPIARPALETGWARGVRSLHAAAGAVGALEVAVASDTLRNVNRPEELSEAEAVARYLDRVPVREIDVDALSAHLAEGARLIDVREPDEYAEGHVPGAVLVPLGTVPDHVDAFAGEGPTYVICRTGGRSMRAAEYVAEHGVDSVNVAGGTMAWIASGRDTVGGDQPS
jgi:rhodanese-related sulfurtransferase